MASALSELAMEMEYRVGEDVHIMQNGQFLLSDMGVDSISLPGGFVTATHPSAQVVYVGTIRYSRDDFFAVTNVRILDRYSQAVSAARQLYGPDVTVAKSLWRTGQ